MQLFCFSSPNVCQPFSHVQLFATPWLLSMGFSRQEYWNELPCPPRGDLTDPGIKPQSLMSAALASRFFTTSTNWEGVSLKACQINHVKVKVSRAECLQPYGLYSPWNSPGQNNGVGSPSLLQGIFSNQGQPCIQIKISI